MDKANDTARIVLKLDFGFGRDVGPGKVRLLELIDEYGSIAAAGRAMGMSYRRAWLLVDNLNTSFAEAAVTTQLGGRGGGGAALTEFGRDLANAYRNMERDARNAVEDRLLALEEAVRRGFMASHERMEARQGA
ncbi:MAG: LysR family transcriptional regulator [Rhodospirillales bacterium]|jgi:molybdate transport system regulatory protein|nr:LysR family transcriptional regulator [Rhodospirillales bacterium]